MQENKFTYDYTAPTQDERREIEDIRRRYANNKKSSIERLRELDGKVKNFPMALSISLGVVGILVFGLGLTLVLEWGNVVWGVITALIGCVPMAVAYPVYNYFFTKNKQKYGNEILELSKQILEGDIS